MIPNPTLEYNRRFLLAPCSNVLDYSKQLNFIDTTIEHSQNLSLKDSKIVFQFQGMSVAAMEENALVGREVFGWDDIGDELELSDFQAGHVFRQEGEESLADLSLSELYQKIFEQWSTLEASGHELSDTWLLEVFSRLDQSEQIVLKWSTVLFLAKR